MKHILHLTKMCVRFIDQQKLKMLNMCSRTEQRRGFDHTRNRGLPVMLKWENLIEGAPQNSFTSDGNFVVVTDET